VGVVILAYSLVVGLILTNFQNQLIDGATDLTMANLRGNASNAAMVLKADFAIARTIAATITSSLNTPTAAREDLTGRILSSTANQSSRYLSTWASLELFIIDSTWQKPYGRKRYTYYQSGDPVVDTVNMEGDNIGSLYHSLKQSKKEELTEPYLLSSTSDVKDSRNDYLGTSVCVPILVDGKFAGLAGIDIALEALDFVTKSKPYPGSTSFLISNKGVVVSHEDRSLVGKNITAIIKSDTTEILRSIAQGNSKSWISENQLIAFTPMKVSETGIQWSIGTVVPIEAVTSEIDKVVIRTLVFSFVVLIVLLVSAYFIARGISEPVKTVNNLLRDLSNGLMATEIPTQNRKDEIGEMMRSLRSLIENTKAKIQFAEAIGNGKFESDFQLSSSDDTLGKALTQMRDNLVQLREEEEKRRWSNDGLALLNDVIREKFSDTAEQDFKVLKTLVNILRANQGGLFIVRQDVQHNETFIDLVSAFAYGRKRFLTKHLSWGEGLVGQCILEGEVLYLKEIPKDYVKITSGLGEATPTILLVVPLKIDSEVIGAIELAAFKQLQQHELTFLRKAADVIASFIYLRRKAQDATVVM
jgi:methyl-accepting chemotaxis protein